MSREIAHIEYLDSEAGMPKDEELIEVTLIDMEQLPHLWSRETLRVYERRTRVVGDVALRLTAVRDEPKEGQSSQVLVNRHVDGRWTMRDIGEVQASA